jgi:hypothetical protein
MIHKPLLSYNVLFYEKRLPKYVSNYKIIKKLLSLEKQ